MNQARLDLAGLDRISPGRIGLILAFVVGLIVAGRMFGADLPALAGRFQELGPLGVLIFSAGYVLATVAFVPGSLLTLAAGAVYGVGAGTVIVFVSATLGASLAFLISRHLARASVEKRLRGHQKFSVIDRAVGDQGFKVVLLLRLSPVFPFNALNYALGLTRVRFRDYVVASIGMLPGTLLYVYYGTAAGSVAQLASGADMMERSLAHYVILGLGLVATLVVVGLVTRAARRALLELRIATDA
jgi:uncharacterized membrane protein YdjX (TVP38/TMEM64 family)